MDEQLKCQLCGEPMPPGEQMFNFHGYSGPCPKPPLPRIVKDEVAELKAQLAAAEMERASEAEAELALVYGMLYVLGVQIKRPLPAAQAVAEVLDVVLNARVEGADTLGHGVRWGLGLTQDQYKRFSAAKAKLDAARKGR